LWKTYLNQILEAEKSKNISANSFQINGDSLFHRVLDSLKLMSHIRHPKMALFFLKE
jgi:ERCC4-related helicase